MNKKEKTISIVIPAYNEGNRIFNTLEDILTFMNCRKYDYEIIIVDDGSSDNTIEVVESLNSERIKVIKHNKNMGKGFAVRIGMQKAKGAYIVFMDADNSTKIREIEKCWEKFEKGLDIVIGSRKLPESEIDIYQPCYRKFMGVCYKNSVKSILKLDVSDITCGFKCFTQETVKKIFDVQSLNRWSFDAEILFLANKYDFKIGEIPVRWKNEENTKVDLLKDTIVSFVDVFRIMVNDFCGKY